MKKKAGDHVKIANRDDGRYEMICEHCDTHTIVTPPLSFDEFLAKADKFYKQHKSCKKEVTAE